MLLLGDTLSGQGGLAHALAPLDRYHEACSGRTHRRASWSRLGGRLCNGLDNNTVADDLIHRLAPHDRSAKLILETLGTGDRSNGPR
jgi:hypothetical protein